MRDTARESSRLNVFISYSRDDLAFADQLDAALGLHDFAVSIDRHGISGGEDWQKRLGSLIRDADTVVFVLSPASATSKVCAWEVEESVRLGKRIIPVLCRPLAGAEPPRRLADLNYIYFYPEESSPGSGFGTGLVRLVKALDTDLDWLREHTRLLQRASEWEAGGRPANRLLTGDLIGAAKSWAARRPKDAPEPTPLHLDFIRESEEEELRRQSAEQQRLQQMAAAQAERAKALEAAEAAQKEQAKALAEAAAAQQRESEASRQAAEASKREAEASRRVARRTIAGLLASLVLAAVAVGFAIYADQQTNEALDAKVKAFHAAKTAEEAARRATVEKSRYLAALATAERKDNDPATALALGLEAFQGEGANISGIGKDILAEGAINQALIDLKERTVLADPAGKGRSESAFYSPSGEHIVTLHTDNHAVIWDARRYEPLGPALSMRADKPAETGLGRAVGFLSVGRHAEPSPDGKPVLLTLAEDGTVKLWSMPNGTSLASLPQRVRRAAFGGGGSRIVTLLDERDAAAVWSPDGTLVAETPARVSGQPSSWHQLRAALMGANEKRLVTVAASGHIEIWDVAGPSKAAALVGETGTRPEQEPAPADRRPSSQAREVNQAALDREQRHVLLIYGNGSAEVWNVEQKSRVFRDSDGRGISAGAFGMTSGRFALGSNDGTVRIIGLAAASESGRLVRELRGHTTRVSSVAFSADGRLVAAGAADATIRVWSAETGSVVAVLRATGRITTESFGQGGQTLVAPAGPATARVFELGTLRPSLSLFGAGAISTRPVFTTDGRFLAYGLGDGSVKIWDWRERKVVKVLAGSAGEVREISISRDGRRFLVLQKSPENSQVRGERHNATIWDIGGPEPKVVKEVKGASAGGAERAYPTDVRVVLSPDGRSLVIVEEDRVALIDAAAGAKLVEHVGGIVGPAAFSRSGSKIVWGVSEGGKDQIQVYDIASRKMERQLGELSLGPELLLGFVDDDDLVLDIAGDADAVGFRGWSVQSGKMILDWTSGKSPQPKLPAGWSQDRLWRSVLSILRGSLMIEDGDVHLAGDDISNSRAAMPSGGKLTILHGRTWGEALFRGLTATSEEYSRLLELPLPAVVKGVAFSSDGRMLAIAGRNEPVQFWQMFLTQRELVEHARQVAPRCLTRVQRLTRVLDEAPPDWCIKLKKWPFNTKEWERWLAEGKKGPMPGRPN